MFVHGENRCIGLPPFICMCVVGALCNEPRQFSPASSSRLNSPEPSRAAHPVDVPELKERPSSTVESIAYDAGGIKVISVNRKEKNQRFAYDLDISYPQIEKPHTSNQRRFNGYVRRVIESDLDCSRSTA
jgi:hypothetical protein